MSQEYRYLSDRAAINEMVANPRDINVRRVELSEQENESILRITFRAFTDERKGRTETHMMDCCFPDVQAARDAMRDLRLRGGYRHKEVIQSQPLCALKFE